MDAVANTSAASHNVQRKSADSLTNRRHRIIRPVSSSLADDKETNGGETRADCVQDYSPCSCSVVSYNQISVVCGGVSVETVRDVFQRVNYPEIYSTKQTQQFPYLQIFWARRPWPAEFPLIVVTVAMTYTRIWSSIIWLFIHHRIIWPFLLLLIATLVCRKISTSWTDLTD